MRILLVSFLALGFVLLDVVVFLAATNMASWTAISTDVLFWMLMSAVALMASSYLMLRKLQKPTLKG